MVAPEPTARSMTSSSAVKSTSRVGGGASQTMASRESLSGMRRQLARPGRAATSQSKKRVAAGLSASAKASPIRHGAWGLHQATRPVARSTSRISWLASSTRSAVPFGKGWGDTSWQPWGPKSSLEARSAAPLPVEMAAAQRILTRGARRGFSRYSSAIATG